MQNVLLPLLGVVWAGLALWVFVVEPEEQHVPLKHVTGQKASRESGRSQAAQTFKVRVDLLDASRRQAETAFGTPKNIFASFPSEEPGVSVELRAKVAAGRRPLPEPLAPQVEVPAVPSGPTAEELAAQAAQAELTQFRYLGYLSRQGRQEAFLSKGKDLHIVKAGDTIEQRIHVKTVSPTGVALQETKTQVEKTVLLAGEGK
jgi:hypothetical protein